MPLVAADVARPHGSLRATLVVGGVVTSFLGLLAAVGCVGLSPAPLEFRDYVAIGPRSEGAVLREWRVGRDHGSCLEINGAGTLYAELGRVGPFRLYRMDSSHPWLLIAGYTIRPPLAKSELRRIGGEEGSQP
jgi:hypothetical protein